MLAVSRPSVSLDPGSPLLQSVSKMPAAEPDWLPSLSAVALSHSALAPQPSLAGRVFSRIPGSSSLVLG